VFADLQGLPEDADAALRSTLVAIIDFGESTDGQGDAPAMRELIAYQTGLRDPLARIVATPSRRLNPIGAVARFVWMVAGNDRLADIKFYEPKVANYTDNGLTVPGSSYGRRMFEPRPGLDQIAGAVARLRKDAASRRAAAVIWDPSDAVRESHDIPCAFGMFFHSRGDGLVATTVMRSNNAVRLLPYNVFEFSLLGEVVAAEIDVPLAAYVHWAASMHILDQYGEMEQARRLAAAGPTTSVRMPEMPRDPSPLRQTSALARHEADVRHASGPVAITAVRDTAARELDPYWLALLDVLVAHALNVAGATEEADEVVSGLPPWIRSDVVDQLAKTRSAPTQEPAGQLTLLPGGRSSAAQVAAAAHAAADPAAAETEVRRVLATLRDDAVSAAEADAVVARILASDDEATLAARSSGAATDRVLTSDEVRIALAEVRGTR
jgi:thymidylate synthase